MTDSAAASLYELNLDRVRLRAIAARKRRDNDQAELEKTQADIRRLDQVLVDVRSQLGPNARDARIAELLRLSPHEIDLLWSAVAATVDPALSPHLRDLAGGDARHGMTVALHAIMAGLDHHSARGLVLALTPLHPLIRYGLLESLRPRL